MQPSPYHRFEDSYGEVSAPLQPILSAFRLRYSTLLSAMEGADGRLEHLVRSSLRQFQMKSVARKAEREMEELRAQLSDGSPEDDGIWEYLRLQGELSAAEKEQKRARSARSKSSRSPGAQRRYERAKEERERLAMLVRRHPFHGKATAMERQAPEQVTVLRRMGKLQSTIESAQAECDQDALQTAAAVRSVLWRLGYVTRRGLSRKARGMREIVASSGIVLSELYEQGVFDDLDSIELAEVISWFACDQDRRKYNSYRLPRRMVKIRRDAQETFRRISFIEKEEGVELAQGPSSWFYGVAGAWCEGASVHEITERVQMGEGDVVGLLNKTVDLLDQFEDLLTRYGDAELLDVTAEARRLLVRGLVAMVRSGERLAAPDETGPSPLSVVS